MNIADYELVSQVSADTVCVRYGALRGSDRLPVQLCVLNRFADNDVLWDQFVKRLRIVRLLAHSMITRVIEIVESNETAFFVVEPTETRSLKEAFGDRRPMDVAEAIPLVAKLTDAVAAAHRYGVAHGELTAEHVGYTDDGDIRIDLTEVAPTVHSNVAAQTAFVKDIHDCGRLIQWLIAADSASGNPCYTLKSMSDDLRELVDRMIHVDSSKRPSMSEVAARFEREATCLFSETVRAPPAIESGESAATFIKADRPAETSHKRTVRVVSEGDQLGRFRLLEELGQGGMGSVFRARDEADESIVAIKVIRPDKDRGKEAFTRFHREAQLLAEVNNPFVTNLIEFNEDDGLPYLVMEFVEGQTLQQRLEKQKKLDEPTAVAIMSDVCRALSDAHRRGIVHRDIKPDNILLAEEPDAEGNYPLRVKLSDFGIARRLEQDQSTQLTRTGSAIGTPLYMSPEQCEDGKSADPRSDVYSVGATLFHLLAGRPPLVATSFARLVRMHGEEAPPYLRTLDEGLSDEVSAIVDRSLAKQREQRYADADDLLTEFDRLLNGESSRPDSHPADPTDDRHRILTYSWTWDLKSSPLDLWPYVSNTDRLNRAIGLPVVRYADTRDENGKMKRIAQFTRLGMTLTWHERPFEWVEPRRFGVFREYSHGPFRWITSVVHMTPALHGTRLRHTIRISPAGLLGRLLAAFEIGFKAPKTLAAVLRRIDETVAAKTAGRLAQDAFEPAQSLTRKQWRRLESQLTRLRESGISSSTVHEFGDFLAEASPQEVARIRPRSLARDMKLDEEELLGTCLRATRNGLLTLGWDILCPACRISSAVHDTLQAVKNHEFCPACDLNYDVDPANSIELVFRVHESIRPVDVQTYCIGGPAHLPHVMAQLTLHGGERLKLDVMLPPGTYAIHSVGKTSTDRVSVFFGASASRGEWRRSQAGRHAHYELKPGEQELTLHNDLADEAVIRIERTVRRDDAIVATRAMALPLFRELFPAEVFSPDTLCAISNMTVLAVTSSNSDELRNIERKILEHGGVITGPCQDELVAVFFDPVTAVRTAVSLTSYDSNSFAPGIGVHSGPASVTGRNSAMVYFGEAIDVARELSQFAEPGNPLISAAVTSDEEVAAFAESAGVLFLVSEHTLVSKPSLLLNRVSSIKTHTSTSSN